MKINKKDLMMDAKFDRRMTKENINPQTNTKHSISNFEEARAYVEGLRNKGSILGLVNIRNLMDEFNNPQDDLSFIHIAGTNGKGSVIAYLKTIFESMGFKVGTFTTPAVFDYKEQFYADGSIISDEDYTEIIKEIAEKSDKLVNEGKEEPTAFEIETALAFLLFARKKCDICLVEVGMGGREDATNIIKRPICSVLTSISMDHTNFLGDTVEKIAYEKAGIIKFGLPVVSAPQTDSVKNMINSVAKDRLTAVYYVSEKDELEVTPSLLGKHQIDNARIAQRVARLVLFQIMGKNMGGFEEICKAVINKGLETTVHRGRFEKISDEPTIYIDGAHNVDAAKSLKETLNTYFTNRPLIFIMGVLKDKDYKGVLKELLPGAAGVITITPNSSRALDGKELLQVANEYCDNATWAENISEAVNKAKDMTADKEKPVIVACGSFTFLNDICQMVK